MYIALPSRFLANSANHVHIQGAIQSIGQSIVGEPGPHLSTKIVIFTPAPTPPHQVRCRCHHASQSSLRRLPSTKYIKNDKTKHMNEVERKKDKQMNREVSTSRTAYEKSKATKSIPTLKITHQKVIQGTLIFVPHMPPAQSIQRPQRNGEQRKDHHVLAIT